MLSPTPLEFALTLMWHPPGLKQSEKEFREMATGAVRSQLGLGVVRRKAFGVRQS